MAQYLPHLNAFLNMVSFILLLAGYSAIRKGRRERHRKFMLGAFWVSALFLCSYLIYHSLATHNKFPGTGHARTIYFFILITHIVLATLIVPLVLRVMFLAQKKRFEEHKWLAKITFPLWVYVSVTGVLVYVFLYHLYPVTA